jgi:hypothetical protein
MRRNGYTVEINNDQNRPAIRNQFKVIVDGYIIEGHVPVAEIEQLLAERPEIVGLAVLGMPAGSPGMGTGTKETFDVISFDKFGNTEVYASYP